MSQNDKSEFLELMMLWRNEGLAPLASVIGFSQALLEEKAGEINEEQRQLLELVFRAGVRAADCWHSAADYATLRDGTSQEACRAYELGEVIDRALSHLEKLTAVKHIRIDIADGLPPAKAFSSLERAFIYLLDTPPLRNYIVNNPLTITADLRNDKNIKVQIRTEQKLEPGIAQQPSSFFHPGTPPAAAQLIIKQHGGELQLRNVQEKTEIEFELPIWDEDADNRGVG